MLIKNALMLKTKIDENGEKLFFFEKEQKPKTVPFVEKIRTKINRRNAKIFLVNNYGKFKNSIQEVRAC